MAKRKYDSVREQYYNQLTRRVMSSNNADNRVTVLESMYERIIGELAMNRFQWTGLPGSVNPRTLELALYENALAVAFVDHRTDKLMILPGFPVGRVNINGDPLMYRVTGPGYPSIDLPAHRVVPIWANRFRIPDWDIVSVYAPKIANADMTIDINIRSARRTKVLIADENMQLSVSNINNALDRGDASVAVRPGIGSLADVIQAVDLGVHPDHIEKLSIVRGRFWSECMGLLGINNANQDKKERLVEAEVSSNDDQIESMRRVNLNSRQEAAYAINDKFKDYLTARVTVDYFTDNADSKFEGMYMVEDDSESGEEDA